jgi:hypothetical protein
VCWLILGFCFDHFPFGFPGVFWRFCLNGVVGLSFFAENMRWVCDFFLFGKDGWKFYLFFGFFLGAVVDWCFVSFLSLDIIDC